MSDEGSTGRSMESKKHYTALSAKNLHFRHSTEERPQVSGVSFVIRAGRTLGVLGRNECGKTTLAQLLLGNLRPDVGEVLVHGNALADNGSGPSAAMPFVRILLLFSLTAGYTLPALPDTWMVIACRAGAFGVAIVLICIEVGRMLRARLDANNRADRLGWAPAQARAAGVAYISSEHDAGQRLDPNLSIEEAIGREMPIKAKAGRRREVLAALGASGFQMYTDNGKPTGDPETYLNDGVTMGQCSGGQRHLIYILSVLASRPTVLIADEMLCGLDIDRQASVLTMLQRLQARTGLTILYLSVDLAPISIVSHNVAFMHEGSFVEMGEAHAVLETPQVAHTKVYVLDCTQLEQQSRGKNLRNVLLTGKSIFDL